MKSDRLLRRIISGIVAEHELARKYMDKINRNAVLSADALTELGNTTYEASRAIATLSKALKDLQ